MEKRKSTSLLGEGLLDAVHVYGDARYFLMEPEFIFDFYFGPCILISSDFVFNRKWKSTSMEEESFLESIRSRGEAAYFSLVREFIFDFYLGP